MPRTPEGVELPTKWIGKTIRVAVIQPHDCYRGDGRYPGEWAEARRAAEQILKMKERFGSTPAQVDRGVYRDGVPWGRVEDHELGNLAERHFIRILEALRIPRLQNFDSQYWVSDCIIRPNTQPLNVDVKIRSPGYDLAMVPVKQFKDHPHDVYAFASLAEDRGSTLWMGWIPRDQLGQISPGTLGGKLPTPSLYLPFNLLNPMWELFLYEPERREGDLHALPLP